MISKIIFIIITICAVLYIISPIDFIPDFIPIIGWFDDLFVGIVGLFTGIMALKH